MGGVGGYTCMSEDAQALMKSFSYDYEEFNTKRDAVKATEMTMMVRAAQMSQFGLLVPETDPDRIAENLNLVDPASLR